MVVKGNRLVGCERETESAAVLSNSSDELCILAEVGKPSLISSKRAK